MLDQVASVNDVTSVNIKSKMKTLRQLEHIFVHGEHQGAYFY